MESDRSYCRTCYLQGPHETFNSVDVEFWVTLKAFTSVEVIETDPYSKLICEQCSTLMKSFNRFKSNCLYVDKLIKETAASELKTESIDIKLELKLDSPTWEDSFDDTGKEKINNKKSCKSSLYKNRLGNLKQNRGVRVCVYCARFFANKKLLKTHISESHQDQNNERQCIYCSKTFKSLFSLNKHFNGCHQDKDASFECKKCSESFHIKEQLELHRKRKHWQTYCCQCNKLVKGLNNLQQHVINRHAGDIPNETQINKGILVVDGAHKDSDIRALKCAQCPKTFTDKRWLKRHALRHETTTPYSCNYCDKSFYELHQLNSHVRESHESVSPLKCENCAQIFYVEAALQKHMTRAHPNTTCGVCFKQTRSLKSLRSHMQLVHSSSAQVHCKICDKIFKHQKSYQSHMDRHRGVDKSRICSVCGLKVLDLNSHMFRKHRMGNRTFTCRRCGQAFNNEKALVDHRKLVHPVASRGPEEYKYQCTHCKRRLLNKANLDAHIKRKHSSSKVYKCTICNTETKIKQSFKRHMIGHSDERKFTCDYCGRKFFHSYLMMRHRRTHTGETPYTCQWCSRAFVHYNSYAAHRKTHQ